MLPRRRWEPVGCRRGTQWSWSFLSRDTGRPELRLHWGARELGPDGFNLIPHPLFIRRVGALERALGFTHFPRFWGGRGRWYINMPRNRGPHRHISDRGAPYP